MYFLCVLATCLAFANGWFLQNLKTRRDGAPQNLESCAAEIQELCSPVYLPGNRNDLFDNNGNLLLNCSEGSLAKEKKCMERLDNCPSYQDPMIGFIIVMKAQICGKSDVFKSGRECWNELDSVDTSSCRTCGEWTCYRDVVTSSTCTEEHFKFLADLNRALVMHINGRC